MKKILIANLVYLPIVNTNKYVAGDISGNIYLNEIYTLDEIRDKHKTSTNKLHELDNLHELTKAWGTR